MTSYCSITPNKSNYQRKGVFWLTVEGRSVQPGKEDGSWRQHFASMGRQRGVYAQLAFCVPVTQLCACIDVVV